MTTSIRIAAAITGAFILYSLAGVENKDIRLWLALAVGVMLIIYALIGHKLKGEGNYYTEDIIDASIRDAKIIKEAWDKNSVFSKRDK